MAESNKILKVENLSVNFDKDEVLKDLSFDVSAGEVLAVIGPNGSGKTVLLRALLGFIPYSGKIEWQQGLKLSYMPQKFNIDKEFPLSVEEFLKFKTNDKEAMFKAFKEVGISDEYHIENHIFRQRVGWLSGGQLQRVMVAWSVLDNPDVIILDEPTSSIDIGGEETIYNLIKKMKGIYNLTVILVSHDLNIVYKHATNVICINKEMICHGLPNVVLDPSMLMKLYGGEASFYKHEH